MRVVILLLLPAARVAAAQGATRAAVRPLPARLETPAAPKRRLYTDPALVKAPMKLRAKAIRSGCKESVETRTVFTIR